MTKSPIIHTKIIVFIQVPYFSIPLIFFSSPLLLLLPFFSLFFSPYPFLPIPKDQNEIFILVLSLFDFKFFFFFAFLVPKLPSICTSTYSNSYFGIQSFFVFVIWVLNWQFTNLPLTFVLISVFAYFIFSIILFRKNIHLLLLYPKHVIKLSGYNLGCYRCAVNQSIPRIASNFDMSMTLRSTMIRIPKISNSQSQHILSTLTLIPKREFTFNDFSKVPNPSPYRDFSPCLFSSAHANH